MFDCLDKKATQAGFSRLVGTSKQAVSQRFADGQLKPDGTYFEWLSVYLDRLRQEAAGRSEKQLAEIRGRKELAQAMREELSLASECRLIIHTPDVAPDLVSLMKKIQSQIMQAGNKALQSVEAEYGVEVKDELILDPLRAALRSVAGSADQLVSTITGEPSTPVSEGTATDL